MIAADGWAATIFPSSNRWRGGGVVQVSLETGFGRKLLKGSESFFSCASDTSFKYDHSLFTAFLRIMISEASVPLDRFVEVSGDEGLHRPARKASSFCCVAQKLFSPCGSILICFFFWWVNLSHSVRFEAIFTLKVTIRVWSCLQCSFE